MTPTISISDAAREHLHEELENMMLRISFTTGCGGSGSRLASASEPQDDDVVVNIDGVRVALDDMSASKLDGAIIEYDESDPFNARHTVLFPEQRRR